MLRRCMKIYQIVGNTKYNDVSFVLDNIPHNGKPYNCKLSSEALCKHFNADKIILLKPISINAKDEDILVNI